MLPTQPTSQNPRRLYRSTQRILEYWRLHRITLFIVIGLCTVLWRNWSSDAGFKSCRSRIETQPNWSRLTVKVSLQDPNSLSPLSDCTLSTPSSPSALHLFAPSASFCSLSFLSAFHSDLWLDCFKIPQAPRSLCLLSAPTETFISLSVSFPSVIHLLSHFLLPSIICRPLAVYQSISPVTVTSQLSLLSLWGTQSPSHHSFVHLPHDFVPFLFCTFHINQPHFSEFLFLFKNFSQFPSSKYFDSIF